MDVHMFRRIFLRENDFGAKAYLLHEISDDLHVQIPQRVRTAVKHRIEAVPVIVEEWRRMIGSVNAAFRLLQPWSGIVHQDFPYGKIETSVHMLDRKIQVLHPVRRINSAAVAV